MFLPKGIIVPIVSSSTSDGLVDKKAIRFNVESLVHAGVHGIMPTGAAGEFALLTVDERKTIAEEVMQSAAGRVDVLPQVGAADTRTTIELARHAKSIGAPAVVVNTPFYIRCSQDELYNHFISVAETASIPVILYDIPHLTANRITTETVVQLAEHELIIGIKDCTFDDAQMINILRLVDPDTFSYLTGEDHLVYMAMLHGARGGITVTSNIVPELFVGIYNAVIKERYKEALKMQMAVMPLLALLRAEGKAFATIKAATDVSGRIAGPGRAPISSISNELREKLQEVIAEINNSIAG